MNYSGLIKNDIVNGEGVCVSFFVQGCPHHCPGCFNPETWDFDGGKPIPADILNQIYDALIDNGIQRNFSLLGGEPLCEENLTFSCLLIKSIREKFPNIKIYVWTGYVIEDLIKLNDIRINNILSNIDYLIDGPFIQEKKDLTLKLRGSSNQRIIDVKKFLTKNKKYDII